MTKDEKAKTPAISTIKSITAAPDFYGWKIHIAEALRAAGNTAMADEVANEGSVHGLYLKKEAIVKALGL